MTNVYIPQVTYDRIKELSSKKGVPMANLNAICDISRNTISKSAKGTEGMKAKNLFMIAEVLECSVDYLLGRTDKPNPETIITENNGNGTNHGVQTFHGDSFPVKLEIPAEHHLDENQQELLKRFAMLSYVDKIEFMQMLINKTEKEGE